MLHDPLADRLNSLDSLRILRGLPAILLLHRGNGLQPERNLLLCRNTGNMLLLPGNDIGRRRPEVPEQRECRHDHRNNQADTAAPRIASRVISVRNVPHLFDLLREMYP